MAEPHVMDALRGKRSELSGIVSHLKQQIVQHRASLVHLDAAMRLFDPNLAPEAIGARSQRPRSVWFRPGECLRLIHDVLREAPAPMTTRALTEQVRRGSRKNEGCRWAAVAALPAFGAWPWPSVPLPTT